MCSYLAAKDNWILGSCSLFHFQLVSVARRWCVLCSEAMMLIQPSTMRKLLPYSESLSRPISVTLSNTQARARSHACSATHRAHTHTHPLILTKQTTGEFGKNSRPPRVLIRRNTIIYHHYICKTNSAVENHFPTPIRPPARTHT